MMWRTVAVIIATMVTQSIKFDYHLNQHEFICFNQNVEQQTRYQLIIKGERPNFVLQVFEDNENVYQDDSLSSFMKYYSAYASSNGIVNFCLANLEVESGYKVEIEFYHGLHLEEADQEGGLEAIRSIMINLEEMQTFIKMGYKMYEDSVGERKYVVENIGLICSVTLVVFFLVTALTRYVFLTKTLRYMKYRKVI